VQFPFSFIVTKRQQLYCTVAFLAVAQLFSGIVPEMVHRDPGTSGTRSSAAVAAHSCGTHEKHVPLEALPVCSFCMMTAQRNTAVVDRPILEACRSFVCNIPQFSPGKPSAVSFHCSGSRAPPASCIL